MKNNLQYYACGNNPEDSLRNGSYCRVYKKNGKIKEVFQFMLGDFHGLIDSVPANMVFVPVGVAKKLLPKCCK